MPKFTIETENLDALKVLAPLAKLLEMSPSLDEELDVIFAVDDVHEGLTEVLHFLHECWFIAESTPCFKGDHWKRFANDLKDFSLVIKNNLEREDYPEEDNHG